MSSKYPEKCHIAGCPCGYFNAKSPSDASRAENQPAGFPALGLKNVSQGEYGAGIAISATIFDHEWSQAPRWATRTTEQEAAEYWFRRGVRAGELSQMLEENRVFREMAEQRGIKTDSSGKDGLRDG